MLLVVAPSSALAGAGDGFYLEGRGGVSLMRDTTTTELELDPQSSFGPSVIRFNFDPDVAAGGVLGYRMDNGLRIEGDIGFRRAEVAGVDIVDAGGREAIFGLDSIVGPSSAVGIFFVGSVETVSGLVNVIYDFDLEPVSPFVGIGAGVARVRVDIVEIGHTGTTVTFADEAATVFAYQAIAGLGMALNERVGLSLRYTYFGTRAPSLKKTVVGGSFKRPFDIRSHNLMLGLQIRF